MRKLLIVLFFFIIFLAGAKSEAHAVLIKCEMGSGGEFLIDDSAANLDKYCGLNGLVLPIWNVCNDHMSSEAGFIDREILQDNHCYEYGAVLQGAGYGSARVGICTQTTDRGNIRHCCYDVNSIPSSGISLEVVDSEDGRESQCLRTDRDDPNRDPTPDSEYVCQNDYIYSSLSNCFDLSTGITCPSTNVICSAGDQRVCCPTQGGRKNTESFVGCENEPQDDLLACEQCVGTVNSPTGKIWTEIGCLDPSPAGIITRMFQIAFGILGGVGILRLMQIGVLYQSQDQEKIKEAREMVFSLFAGIILMIMGIVILRFLGVNVLGLPDNFLGV